MSFIQRLFGHESSTATKEKPAQKPVSFDLPFSMWLAVHAPSSREAAQALGLADVSECEWAQGIARSCSTNSMLFVSEPVGEWCLVCGNALPDLGYRRAAVDWLCGLPVGQLNYFAYHKAVGMRYFFRCVDGNIARAYAYIQGEIKMNIGGESAEEESLGIHFPQNDDELFDMGFDCVPGEQAITKLAGAWSVDPTALDPALQPGGLIGTFKMPAGMA